MIYISSTKKEKKMNTRSYIAMQTENGYKGIYCHNDGSPKINGKILLNSYQNHEKVKKLINLGAVSCIDENIGSQISFNDLKKRRENKQCVAYHRDRGDALQIHEFKSRKELINHAQDWYADYIYIFEDGKWRGFEAKGYELLLDVYKI